MTAAMFGPYTIEALSVGLRADLAGVARLPSEAPRLPEQSLGVLRGAVQGIK